MKGTLLTLLLLGIAAPVFAGELVVFTGIPEIKISEGGISRLAENMTKDNATKFKCTITRIDNGYYWTSRENVEVVPITSGASLTYWAVNGSGYVRVVRSEMKKAVKKMGAVAGDPEERFDYVEHLLLGLKSVTYYGKER